MANIANKNPLFQSTKDTFGNVKFTLNAYSAKDFLNLRTMVQYPINFQRYYLFINPPGAKGHEWQRNLFANLINYQPLGMIEWVRTIAESTGKLLNSLIEYTKPQSHRTIPFLYNNDWKQVCTKPY